MERKKSLQNGINGGELYICLAPIELEPKNFIIIWRGVHVVLTPLPSMDWAGTWHTPDALKPFWHAHFEPNAVVSFFPTHVSLQLLCTLPWAQTMGADRASIVGKPSRVTPLVVGLSIYSQLHHLEKGPRKFIRKQMWHMVFLFGCFWALALRPTSSSRCGQGPSCIPGLFFFEVVIDPPWIASVGNQVDSRNHISCLSLADVCWYYADTTCLGMMSQAPFANLSPAPGLWVQLPMEVKFCQSRSTAEVSLIKPYSISWWYGKLPPSAVKLALWSQHCASFRVSHKRCTCWVDGLQPFVHGEFANVEPENDLSEQDMNREWMRMMVYGWCESDN